MSLVVVNGFCSRNCQDNYLSSLLYCLEHGIGNNVPSTSNAEIFTRPPWELYDFFPRAYLPGERCRAWLFEHTAFPQELVLMPTFFKWSFDYYETSRLNGLEMSVQHLKFSYKKEKHEVHANNSICDCDHKQNTEDAQGWKMSRYKRGDFAICCLTYKVKEMKKPTHTRKKSSKRFFESGEGDDDDEDTNKKKKNPATKNSTPLRSLCCASTGNVSQQGVKSQGIFFDAKGHCTGEAETKLEEGQTTKTIEDLNSSAKVPSDYLSHEEMLGFKKPKNNKDGLEISALEAEAVALGMGAEDLGSLKDGSRQALKEGKEWSENEKQSYANEAADGDTVETPYLVLSGIVKPGQTSDPQSRFATVEKDVPGYWLITSDLVSLKDGSGQALKEGKERSENDKQSYANEATDGDIVETPYIVLSGNVKPGQTSDPLSRFATVETDVPGSWFRTSDLGSLKDGSRQALEEGKERSENEKQSYANEATDGDTVETPYIVLSGNVKPGQALKEGKERSENEKQSYANETTDGDTVETPSLVLSGNVKPGQTSDPLSRFASVEDVPGSLTPMLLSF